eukprot:6484721-Amphidinium_carterae.2
MAVIALNVSKMFGVLIREAMYGALNGFHRNGHEMIMRVFMHGPIVGLIDILIVMGVADVHGRQGITN